MTCNPGRYRCNTEQEALAWMEQQAGRKMHLCAFPSTPGINYYISTDGILYTCQYHHTLNIYEAYSMLQRIPKLDEERRGLLHMGVFYKLSSNGNVKIAQAAKLVYCTYVLGYWDEGINILFKDGNRCNIELSNLAEQKKYTLTDKHADKMRVLLTEYIDHFKRIQDYVQYKEFLSVDDAKDCVEDAFLILLDKIHGKDIEHFTGYWIVMAAKMAFGYAQRRIRHRNIDSIEFGLGNTDIPYEINLLDVLEDSEQRKVMGLVAEGYSQFEIGKMTGLTKRQVQIRQGKASQILRDYLKTDKEIMKIYA